MQGLYDPNFLYKVLSTETSLHKDFVLSNISLSKI